MHCWKFLYPCTVLQHCPVHDRLLPLMYISFCFSSAFCWKCYFFLECMAALIWMTVFNMIHQICLTKTCDTAFSFTATLPQLCITFPLLKKNCNCVFRKLSLVGSWLLKYVRRVESNNWRVRQTAAHLNKWHNVTRKIQYFLLSTNDLYNLRRTSNGGSNDILNYLELIRVFICSNSSNYFSKLVSKIIFTSRL